MTTSAIRPWYLELRGRHPSTAEKAYRLLRAILATAVADEVIVKNPCTIKGASVEHAPERPVASVAEVQALAAAMPERLALLVLLAAWCGLRYAELRALRRADIDLLHGTIRVARSLQDARGGGRYERAPKSTWNGSAPVCQRDVDHPHSGGRSHTQRGTDPCLPVLLLDAHSSTSGWTSTRTRSR
ncbi:MAG: hypothetical protein ACRDZQ_14170 [Acidimicrobiales bacterium]